MTGGHGLLLLTYGRSVGRDDLVCDDLRGLGAGGGAAVGVLLDRVTHVPEARERSVVGEIESRDRTLRRPIIARDSAVQDARPAIEIIDVLSKVLQEELRFGGLIEVSGGVLRYRGADIEIPTLRCHFGAQVGEVGDVSQ